MGIVVFNHRFILYKSVFEYVIFEVGDKSVTIIEIDGEEGTEDEESRVKASIKQARIIWKQYIRNGYVRDQ
jgi:hypothetical protein